MESAGKKASLSGRILTALAALPFLASAAMKFSGSPQVIQGLDHFGWSQAMLTKLAVLELLSVVLYLIPPLSILGGIVLTGFLGGAVATHLRIGEPVYIHVVLGVMIWLGLFLREPRLRVLIPVRGKGCVFEREITINRPSDVVFTYLKSLKNFQNWNPYLKVDPQARLQYSGSDGQAGSLVAWEGNKKLGQGEQEITKIVEGQKVQFELRFKRPFENTTSGSFSAMPAGQGRTQVKWTMDGRPIFPMTIFALFLNVDKMMGCQFEAGLKELKGILEK
jgi:hypothetical protein